MVADNGVLNTSIKNILFFDYSNIYQKEKG
jgi:hypothetical protein